MTKERARWVRIFATLGCFCLVAYLLFRVFGFNSQAALDREVALAKKDGMLVDVADLYPKNRVNSKDNGVVAFAAIFPLKSPPYDEKLASPALKPGEALPSATVAMIGACQPVIRQLRAAAAKPSYQPYHDYRQAHNMVMPELGWMRRTAKLMALDARLSADRLDFDRAANEIQTIFKIANDVGQEPIFNAAWVNMALRSFGVRAIQEILLRHGHDQRILSFVHSMQSVRFNPVEFRKVLGGNVALTRQTLLLTRKGGDISWFSGYDYGPGGFELSALRFAFTNSTISTEIEARVVAEQRTLFKDMPSDPNDFEGISAAGRRQRERLDKDNTLIGRLIQSPILIPDCEYSGESIGTDIALRRLLHCALRIYERGLRSGNWLIDLDGGVESLDPFTGKPFLSNKSSDITSLYSVGHNRTDDHGTRYTDDIVFRLK